MQISKPIPDMGGIERGFGWFIVRAMRAERSPRKLD
jgi:hypothetical protein